MVTVMKMSDVSNCSSMPVGYAALRLVVSFDLNPTLETIGIRATST
jgi:hypothetical protein